MRDIYTKRGFTDMYKVLVCENCGNEFVFSKEEQDIYRERGLADPSHCPICRGMFEAQARDKKEKGK